jgi:hypothetical protein
MHAKRSTSRDEVIALASSSVTGDTPPRQLWNTAWFVCIVGSGCNRCGQKCLKLARCRHARWLHRLKPYIETVCLLWLETAAACLGGCIRTSVPLSSSVGAHLQAAPGPASVAWAHLRSQSAHCCIARTLRTLCTLPVPQGAYSAPIPAHCRQSGTSGTSGIATRRTLKPSTCVFHRSDVAHG